MTHLLWLVTLVIAWGWAILGAGIWVIIIGAIVWGVVGTILSPVLRRIAAHRSDKRIAEFRARQAKP